MRISTTLIVMSEGKLTLTDGIKRSLQASLKSQRREIVGRYKYSVVFIEQDTPCPSASAVGCDELKGRPAHYHFEASVEVADN